MKKIISLVAACAMIATMATSFVTVSAASKTIKADVAVSKMTDSDFSEIMDESIPEGKEAYKAIFGISDFGELNCTIAAKKHSGVKLSTAQIDIPGLGADADTYWTMSASNCFDATLTEGFEGDNFSTMFSDAGAAVAYPLTAASGITSIDSVFELVIVVPTGYSKTLDYKFTGMTTEYSKGIAVSGSEIDLFADGKITIGTPAPATKLDKVVISGATATTLTVGDEVTLTAKAYNDDETEKAAAIAWTVEGDAVTVADGLVKAVKEGTATVTATAVDGEITKSASVTFTVETEKLPALPEVTVAGGDVAGQEVKSGENTIGYLWKAIFNAATIKDKYIATFKSGAETNAATLKGFAAHNIEGEGNVSVIVALNTAKAAVTLGITE